jgi:hypothetical protein
MLAAIVGVDTKALVCTVQEKAKNQTSSRTGIRRDFIRQRIVRMIANESKGGGGAMRASLARSSLETNQDSDPSRRVAGLDPLIAPTLARQPRFGGRISDLVDPFQSSPHLTLHRIDSDSCSPSNVCGFRHVQWGAPERCKYVCMPSQTPGNPPFSTNINHRPLAPFLPPT